MLDLLDNDYVFEMHTLFKGEFLSPIIHNLNEKYRHHYDDYNEVYHCNHLIHEIKKLTDVTLNYHTIYLNEQCIGIALISYGNLDSTFFLGQDHLIKNPTSAIVLNYFHISQKGQGLGTHWLTKVIMPFYKSQNKETLYLKSSHKNAFSLYERLGKKIGDYTTQSDNHQFQRHGHVYEIKL